MLYVMPASAIAMQILECRFRSICVGKNIVRMGSSNFNVTKWYKKAVTSIESYHLSICSQSTNAKLKKTQNAIRFGFRRCPSCRCSRPSLTSRPSPT